jgi:hypothetical protein
MIVKFRSGVTRAQIQTLFEIYGATAVDFVPRLTDGELALARFDFGKACAYARCDGRATAANLAGLGLLLNTSTMAVFTEPNWYIEVRRPFCPPALSLGALSLPSQALALDGQGAAHGCSWLLSPPRPALPHLTLPRPLQGYAAPPPVDDPLFKRGSQWGCAAAAELSWGYPAGPARRQPRTCSPLGSRVIASPCLLVPARSMLGAGTQPAAPYGTNAGAVWDRIPAGGGDVFVGVIDAGAARRGADARLGVRIARAPPRRRGEECSCGLHSSNASVSLCPPEPRPHPTPETPPHSHPQASISATPTCRTTSGPCRARSRATERTTTATDTSTTRTVGSGQGGRRALLGVGARAALDSGETGSAAASLSRVLLLDPSPLAPCAPFSKSQPPQAGTL